LGEILIEPQNMIRLITRKPRCLRALVTALIFSSLAGKANAQMMNPYSMATQTAAYNSFEFMNDMIRHTQQQMLLNNRAKDAADGQTGMLRSEFSGGIIITNADYRLNYRVTASYNENDNFDTTISATVKPTSALHFGWQGGYPLATLGGNSALLLGFGINYSFFSWKQPEFDVMGDKKALDFKSTAAGFPFTLDYKIGAEALLDRSKRTCLTIGLGVQPSVSFAKADGKSTDTYFSMLPAGKVEFGFATSFAAFKLRATGLLRKQQYMNFTDVHDGSYNHIYDVSVKGNSQIILALVIMPFASKWEDAAWYRQ
jgi:hypothetical protein